MEKEGGIIIGFSDDIRFFYFISKELLLYSQSSYHIKIIWNNYIVMTQ